MAKVYFLKFNINEKIYDVHNGETTLTSLLKKVFNGLNQQERIQDEHNKSIIYKFVNLNHIEKKMVINGDIAKIYDGVDSNYDETLDEIIDRPSKNKAEYVSFSFDVRQEVIGFVPKRGFSQQEFINYFNLLVDKCVPKVGGIELILIKSKDQLDAAFKKMEKLRDIEVYLVPENNDRKDMEKLLEGILPEVEEANAKNLVIKLQGTLKAPLDKSAKIIEKLKRMTVMGYGKLKASGRNIEGDEYNIDSEKDLLMKKDIRDDNRNSLSEIEELTQKGIKNYIEQRAKEVRDYGGEQGKSRRD